MAYQLFQDGVAEIEFDELPIIIDGAHVRCYFSGTATVSLSADADPFVVKFELDADENGNKTQVELRPSTPDPKAIDLFRMLRASLLDTYSDTIAEAQWEATAHIAESRRASDVAYHRWQVL